MASRCRKVGGSYLKTSAEGGSQVTLLTVTVICTEPEPGGLITSHHVSPVARDSVRRSSCNASRLEIFCRDFASKHSAAERGILPLPLKEILISVDGHLFSRREGG